MRHLYNSLALLISLFAMNTLIAQFVFEDWVSKTGTQDFYYYGKSVTDASMNVYQVGATFNDEGNYDAIVTKFNKSGVQLWTKTFDGPTGGDDTFTDIVLDGSSIYITGSSRNSSQNSAEVFTIVLTTSAGSTVWSDRHSYSGSIYNVGTAITFDGNGNIYVGGVSYNTTTFSDAMAIKYNSSGVMQWDMTEDINGMEDAVAKIIYSNGYLTLTGATQENVGKWRYLAFNVAISTGWVFNTITGSSNVTSIDQIRDVVLDDSGNIYLTGFAGTTSEGYNMYTMKLDEDLNVVWDHSYNYSGSGDDRAFGIALDNSDNVIVTGCSDLGGGNNQFTTIKYNSSGTIQWDKHYDVSTAADTAKSVTTDDSGNIYITGSFYNGSNQDVKTIKYDSYGEQLWEIDYNGVSNGDEYVLDILHDGESVLVTTQTFEGGSYSYAAIKYFEREVTTPPDEEDIPSSKYFTQNAGILRTTSGSMASTVKFIDKTDYPLAYVHDDKLSYVFAKIDSLGNDTVHRIDMVFNKDNKDLKMHAMDKIDFYQNYYLPTVAQGKRERVASYQKLISFDTWDKIDLMITHNNKGLKYYLICKPGFDPADIAWSYSGASAVTVNGSGELVLSTNIGEIVLPEGEAYEVTAGGVRIDKVWQPGFSATGANVSLTLGAYNSSNTLVLEIDKGVQAAGGGGSGNGNMLWNTLYGASGIHPKGVASNNWGDLHFLIDLQNSAFPINPGQNILGEYINKDVAILKLDEFKVPQWISILGGTMNDLGHGIVAQSVQSDAVLNDVYICGRTYSEDFTVEDNGGEYVVDDNSECDFILCSKGFVSQVSESGELVWSTKVGGLSEESTQIFDIDLNSVGRIYGIGHGGGDPSILEYKEGAYNSTIGSGYIVEFNESNRAINWATGWKGELEDIEIDAQNRMYVTGQTYSASFPIVNEPSAPGSNIVDGPDVFVTRFGQQGNIDFSFVYGEDCEEFGTSLSLSTNGVLFVGGIIEEECGNSSIPDDNLIINGYSYQGGSSDAIVLKVDVSNNTPEILYAGFFGSAGDENPNPQKNCLVQAISNEFLIVYGGTQSSINETVIFPSNNPQNYYVKNQITSSGIYNHEDSYLALFNSQMELVWSSYYGSSFKEYISGVTWNESLNRLTVCGYNYPGWILIGDDEVSTVVPFNDFDPVDFNPILESDFYQENPGISVHSSGLEFEGPAGYFASFEIADLDVLSIISSKLDEKARAWPNPSISSINFSLERELFTIEIFNVLGQKIYNDNVREQTKSISTDGWKPGIYVAKLTQRNSVTYSVNFVVL